MPNLVNLNEATSIDKASGFVNILSDRKNASFKDCMRWQESINKYGSRVDIESDDWMLGVLEASMESDLKAEISSDMADIPIHQQGVIMMFYIITKHIFARN